VTLDPQTRDRDRQIETRDLDPVRVKESVLPNHGRKPRVPKDLLDELLELRVTN